MSDSPQHLDRLRDEARKADGYRTVQSQVDCQSGSGPHRCSGRIYVKVMTETGEVYWHCPVCEDNGTLQLT